MKNVLKKLVKSASTILNKKVGTVKMLLTQKDMIGNGAFILKRGLIKTFDNNFDKLSNTLEVRELTHNVFKGLDTQDMEIVESVEIREKSTKLISKQGSTFIDTDYYMYLINNLKDVKMYINWFKPLNGIKLELNDNVIGLVCAMRVKNFEEQKTLEDLKEEFKRESEQKELKKEIDLKLVNEAAEKSTKRFQNFINSLLEENRIIEGMEIELSPKKTCYYLYLTVDGKKCDLGYIGLNSGVTLNKTQQKQLFKVLKENLIIENKEDNKINDSLSNEENNNTEVANVENKIMYKSPIKGWVEVTEGQKESLIKYLYANTPAIKEEDKEEYIKSRFSEVNQEIAITDASNWDEIDEDVELERVFNSKEYKKEKESLKNKNTMEVNNMQELKLHDSELEKIVNDIVVSMKDDSITKLELIDNNIKCTYISKYQEEETCYFYKSNSNLRLNQVYNKLMDIFNPTQGFDSFTTDTDLLNNEIHILENRLNNINNMIEKYSNDEVLRLAYRQLENNVKYVLGAACEILEQLNCNTEEIENNSIEIITDFSNIKDIDTLNMIKELQNKDKNIYKVTEDYVLFGDPKKCYVLRYFNECQSHNSYISLNKRGDHKGRISKDLNKLLKVLSNRKLEKPNKLTISSTEVEDLSMNLQLLANKDLVNTINESFINNSNNVRNNIIEINSINDIKNIDIKDQFQYMVFWTYTDTKEKCKQGYKGKYINKILNEFLECEFIDNIKICSHDYFLNNFNKIKDNTNLLN